MKTRQASSLRPPQPSPSTFDKTTQALLAPQICLQRCIQSQTGFPTQRSSTPNHPSIGLATPSGTIFNNPTTRLQSLFFKLQPGGKINLQLPMLLPRISLSTRTRRPMISGSHGASGRITPRNQLPHTNQGGLTTHNPLLTTAPHTFQPQNHLRHSPPPTLHHHATSRKNLPLLGATTPPPR